MTRLRTDSGVPTAQPLCSEAHGGRIRPIDMRRSWVLVMHCPCHLISLYACMQAVMRSRDVVVLFKHKLVTAHRCIASILCPDHAMCSSPLYSNVAAVNPIATYLRKI